MSAWKLIVAELHALGRPDPLPHWPVHDKRHAREVGAIEPDPAARRGRGIFTTWRLTPIGRDYAERRITQRERRPGGRYWAATWLQALPRDVRIGAPPDVIL